MTASKPRKPRKRAPPKTKTGAPKGSRSKYKAEYAETAKGMCFIGATHKELAEFFGVDETTIERWASAHPEFRQALKERELADDRVVRALYMNAIGGVAVKKTRQSTPIMRLGEVVAHRVTETVVTEEHNGDVKAQTVWLRNRRPEAWNERHEVNVTYDMAEAVREGQQRVLEKRKAEGSDDRQ